MWDPRTHQQIGATIAAANDSDGVYGVAFNSAGTVLATADGDGTVRLWDPRTQRQIGTTITAAANGYGVLGVAFNPAGTMLATADGDGTIRPDGPEHLRRRALTGQLLMIVTGLGVLAGGITVSIVGLTAVFVPTDLEFLDTDAAHLQAADPHLMAFIAHDRAGFGGALASAGIAITLLSLWGWRRGETWVWWTLLLAAISGFGPTLAIHYQIHYTDFSHLAPVYLGAALAATALTLARPYLCDTRDG